MANAVPSFSELSKSSKRRLTTSVIGTILVSLYLSGIGTQHIIRLITGNLEAKLSYNPIVALYCTVTTQMGWALFAGCILLVILACFFSNQKDKLLNMILFTDERGVGFAKRGTYGTARWLTKSDIEKSEDFEFGPIEKLDGIVLAQLDEKGKQVVAVNRSRRGNLNTAVIGNPGTGKSAGFVRANILQSIKIGNSVIVTDPKGELFTSMAPSLIERGVEVKAFNLKDPEFSDSWDCLGEVFDPLTGEANIDRVTDFVTIIIDNTGGQSVDPVYSQGAANLLKAVIMYAAFKREQQLREAYGMIFNQMRMQGYFPTLPQTSVDYILETLNSRSASNIKQKQELLEKLVAKANCSDEKKKGIWDKCMANVKECTLSTVYHILANNKDVPFTELFKEVPEGHPGRIAYSFYESAPEKLQASFLGGLGTRLQLLQSQSIRRITRNKDIDLSRPGETQVAYFLIIPDQSKSTRTLSSIFFNFLFKDLCDAADAYGPDTRVPVDVICDEFTNIGMIPDMATKMTIVRSRKIGITILFQYPSQVDEIYGENGAAIITGACDTLLFLGTNEAGTKKLISQRSGEATIAVNTVKVSKGVGRVEGLAKEYAESAGEGKRFVVTEHEVGALKPDKCLVFLGTNDILKANKFWWWIHPQSKNEDGTTLKSMLITDYSKADEKYAETEHLDPFSGANDKAPFMAMPDDALFGEGEPEMLYSKLDDDVDRLFEGGENNEQAQADEHIPSSTEGDWRSEAADDSSENVAEMQNSFEDGNNAKPTQASSVAFDTEQRPAKKKKKKGAVPQDDVFSQLEIDILP